MRINLCASGQLLFQEDFQGLLVLLIKHLYLSNSSPRIRHRNFNVSKPQSNPSCLIHNQMLECKLFLSFFYNMRTVNVTGSPQCKCFALTLIKIPYQLQATLEDVLLQTKQESGFSWTSHGVLFHQHQFGFRP